MGKLLQRGKLVPAAVAFCLSVLQGNTNAQEKPQRAHSLSSQFAATTRFVNRLTPNSAASGVYKGFCDDSKMLLGTTEWLTELSSQRLQCAEAPVLPGRQQDNARPLQHGDAGNRQPQTRPSGEGRLRIAGAPGQRLLPQSNITAPWLQSAGCRKLPAHTAALIVEAMSDVIQTTALKQLTLERLTVATKVFSPG